MHLVSLLFSTIWWSILLQGCLAAPSSHSTKTACNSKDANLALLKESVQHPLAFCKFWAGSSYKNTSPFSTLSVNTISNVCLCVISKPSIVGSTVHKKPHAASDVKYLQKLEDDVTSPLPFCKFWASG